MSSPSSLNRESSGDTSVSGHTSTSSSSCPNTSKTKPRSHHAKSRRLTTQPPPLKSLAPKPTAAASRWQPLLSANRDVLKVVPASPKKPSVCSVCRRSSCQLTSHRNLVSSTRKEGKRIDSNASSITDEAYRSSYAYHLAQQYVDPAVGQGRVDPFHNLPLPKKHDTAHNHFLFHYYFSYETKQGLQVPQVPHLSEDLILNPFFVVAMKDPAVCLSVLALASSQLPTNRSLPPDKVGALEFSAQAMSLISQAMVAGEPPSDDLIVAQVFLWATSTHFLDKNDMQTYAQSVHTLVRARGGLKKLGFQGKIEQFVRWIDTRFALIAHVSCKYADAPEPPSSLLVKTPSKKYGTFWESERAAEVLSHEVLESCQRTCRQTEVIEDTFVNGMTMSTLWWLMGNILFVQIPRSRLLELFDGTGTINETVMLANELGLEFAVDNVIKQRNAVVCHSEPLVKALQTIDEQSLRLLERSYGGTELLMWVLFMVVMIPHEFEGKQWARTQLCRVVRVSFEDGVPPDWSVRIWDSLAQFTWSNLKNRKFFDAVCRDIRDEVRNEHD